MRLPIIILVAALAVGGTVITLGFLTEPEVAEAPAEEVSAFERLEKYRDDLIKVNESNREALDEIKAADPGLNETSQIGPEIAVLEEVIAQNMEEIQNITERLAEMVPEMAP